MPITTINVKQLQEAFADNSDLHLIDVRSPAEFQAVHAKGATNFPLNELNAERLEKEFSVAKSDTVYMICKMGGRSQKACEQMEKAGYENLVNVMGGTDDWVKHDFPSVQGEGKPMMAINRQVQIAAGSIVLVGIALSFLSPWFLIVSGFVGAGLVFSGLTDTCAMGTILASMPWNQAK